MSTTKIKFNDEQKMFHILTAFLLFEREMYVHEKLEEIKAIECDEKVKASLDKIFVDYREVESFGRLTQTVEIFNPVFYDKLKTMKANDAILEIVEYLNSGKVAQKEDKGGKGVIHQASPIKPVTTSSMPPDSVLNARQMSDIKGGKGIIVTNTIPKNLKKP